MRTRTRLVTVLAVAALAGAVAPAGVAGADDHPDDLPPEVAALREAVEPFESAEAAVAAGYLASPHCVSSPEGAMGFHYVNPELLQAEPDPLAPPILVYDEDGELAAVEYLIPDADQDLTTDEDRPSMFGQPFDGPMPGHEPGMPIHYDLHIWTHEENPNGLFAPWNPDEDCMD
jgi:hypothetical protein